jgi:hypothetical protein
MKIRIGPMDFKVGQLPAALEEDRYGDCCRATLEIRLRRKFASPAERACTLIHEILHAVIAVYRVKLPDEEYVVEKLETGIAQVLRDNPKLFTEILKALK